MNAYEAYIDYMALKQHFSENNYDYFKYNGKTKVTLKRFNQHRFYYDKLARRKDPHHFLLANLIDKDRWIGEMTEDRYTEWLGRTESLTYRFQQNLNSLPDDYKECVRISFGQLPELIAAYFRGQIIIETLVIVIDIIGLWEYYSKIDDPLWRVSSYRFRQYVPFVSYNKPLIQAKLLEKWDGKESRS